MIYELYLQIVCFSLHKITFPRRIYFPMQNLEKISPRTSSVPMMPVIVPREARAERRSSARRSVGREPRPERTARSDAAASRSAAAWRALVTSTPSAEAFPTIDASSSRNLSSPKPLLAEIHNTSGASLSVISDLTKLFIIITFLLDSVPPLNSLVEELSGPEKSAPSQRAAEETSGVVPGSSSAEV